MERFPFSRAFIFTHRAYMRDHFSPFNRWLNRATVPVIFVTRLDAAWRVGVRVCIHADDVRRKGSGIPSGLRIGEPLSKAASPVRKWFANSRCCASSSSDVPFAPYAHVHTRVESRWNTVRQNPVRRPDLKSSHVDRTSDALSPRNLLHGLLLRYSFADYGSFSANSRFTVD